MCRTQSVCNRIHWILLAADFVYIDNDISAFNEWFSSCENIFVYDVNEQDDDNSNYVSTDISPKITEAMKIMQKLRLLATTKHLKLHKLIDVYLDSHFSKVSRVFTSGRLYCFNKRFTFFIVRLRWGIKSKPWWNKFFIISTQGSS